MLWASSLRLTIAEMRARRVFVSVVGIILLMNVTAAQFLRVKHLKNGNKPNACGVIIAQCMGRCSSRFEDESERTEYIQMTIEFANNNTKCTTKETGNNEIVSANPPNDDSAVVVFNVPCCQQRPFERASSSRVIRNATASKANTPALSTTVSTTRMVLNFHDIYASRNKVMVESASHTPSSTDVLQLVLSVICFVLVSLILAIMLWKVCKKRRKTALKTTQHLTNASSNGAVLVGIINENPAEKGARTDVKSNTEVSIPERCKNNRLLAGQSPGDFLEEKGSSDYVLLETVKAQTNSNSTKSARNVENKPEEVLIIGSGSKRFHATDSHHEDPKNETKSGQKQEPPQGDAEKLKSIVSRDRDVTFQNNRSDWALQPTEATNVSGYNKLGSTLTESAVDDAGNELVLERVNHIGVDNGQIAEFLNHNGIYNVLRTKETNDHDGDYQHLKRTDPNKSPSGVHSKSIPSTFPEVPRPSKLRYLDNEYVRDFQLPGEEKTTPLDWACDGRTIPIIDYPQTFPTTSSTESFFSNESASRELTDNTNDESRSYRL